MEWIPKPEGIKELIKLFNDSRGSNNAKHREVFEKINFYCKNKEFTNYLVFILNSEDMEEWLRQISGLTLKGIMERQFFELHDDDLEYFKKNILKSYLHIKPCIRKTISNLINTFLRNGGLQMWPEILEILYNNLDNDVGVSMSLETLIIIIEDSGNLIEEKHSNFLFNLCEKLTLFLSSTTKTKIDNLKNYSKEFSLLNLVLKTLQILLENCSSFINLNLISQVLISITHAKNNSIRDKLGRCWLTMIKLNHEAILQNSPTQTQSLFNFFNENLSSENYDLNFLAAEFYLYIIDEDNEISMSEEIIQIIKMNIKNLINYFYIYSKLTNNDICGEEMENKDCDVSRGESDFTANTCINTDNEEDPDSDCDEIDEIIEEKINTYNKTWSLRKCCSKLIDKLSFIFPNEVLSVIQSYLEFEIEHKDWIVRERSILILGAIGIGCFQGLKPNLNNLINYLFKEMSNSNKLIRAITCWTTSRFTSYIVSDESNSLLRLFLLELLKRFPDPESIVQEAACSALKILVTDHKEKLLPYLADVFNIITSTYNNFKKSSLIALYDCIELLTESFPESFVDAQFVFNLLQNIMQKWVEFIQLVKTDKESTLLNDVSKVNFFDVIIAVLKVSYQVLHAHFDDFFNGCLLVIESYHDDKDIVCRCLDLISVLIQHLPYQFTLNANKGQLITVIFNLIKYDKDQGLKQYVIALIGDICKTDNLLLNDHLDRIVQILIQNLNLTCNKGSVKYDINQISVCNNSCWTLGLLSGVFKNHINLYINSIMSKLIAIFGLPKLNKSLAQNVAILIGRLSLVNSMEVSNYLDSFTKQFCLSIKLVPDGVEKQEAFSGICQAIIHNPNGTLRFFAFLCDSICTYKSPPLNLENLFQNIILSYKELLGGKFAEYFNSFPEKLKQKIQTRFLFI